MLTSNSLISYVHEVLIYFAFGNYCPLTLQPLIINLMTEYTCKFATFYLRPWSQL